MSSKILRLFQAVVSPNKEILHSSHTPGQSVVDMCDQGDQFAELRDTPVFSSQPKAAVTGTAPWNRPAARRPF